MDSASLSTFNRTILELKWKEYADELILRITFNRTILELKFAVERGHAITHDF